MYGIFNKPFKDITQEDINRLITDNERESLYLEYKETLKLDDIAVDVCAMANAQGGYIVIGISEKTDNPDGEGYPDQIKPIVDARCQEIRLRDKVKDSIDPQIPGFQLRLVEVADGFVILAEIPNSMMKPHFVAHSKYRPFPLRISRATSYWTMGDVRAHILSRADPDFQVMKRIDELVQGGINQKSLAPHEIFLALPTFWGNEIVDLHNTEIQNLIKIPPGDINNGYGMHTAGFNFRYCLEGIETFQDHQKTDEINRSYLKLHRLGFLEFVDDGNFYRGNGYLHPNYENIIGQFVHFINCYKELARILNLYEPITISFQLRNLIGAQSIEFRNNPLDIQFFHEPANPTENLVINVSYPSIYEKGIKEDICTRFFNTYGIAEIPSLRYVKLDSE